jgi:agmatinase
MMIRDPTVLHKEALVVSEEQTVTHFDPSQAISADFGIFGLPVTEEAARLILLPVPWEVTTSYGQGASLGPEIIRQASEQVDLFDLETGKAYEAGYFMKEIPQDLLTANKAMKAKAQELIQLISNMDENFSYHEKLRDEVNIACADMTEKVYRDAKAVLQNKKLLGLIGGDHSTPLGAIRAVSESVDGEFGVLHIDAHADLRRAYQGFTQSHASIMYNVMSSPFRPKKLVQVGIRDFCEEEFDFIKAHDGDIKTFFDIENKRRQLQGESWASIATEIVRELPKNVYVSFDIDGLDPALCPNTGTPVAGGLQMSEVFFLLRSLVESGHRIIGFDLNEVSPGKEGRSEWDGNVGARILYKLCGWSILSN